MNRFGLALLTCVLAAAAAGEVRPSFAGRVDLDAPVGLTLAPTAVIAPWKPMLASRLEERPDGTRLFAFTKRS